MNLPSFWQFYSSYYRFTECNAHSKTILASASKHSFLFDKSEMIGEFLDFFWISCGFLFFDFKPAKSWHSLHLRTERYMTPPDGPTISSVRPADKENDMHKTS